MEQNQELNQLLEDALDDLLDGTEEAREAPVKEEPVVNVKESLTKITEVTGGGRDGLGVDVDEMNRFFESMTAQLKAELPKIDPEEAKTRINESVPQIFDMMQNLLSKELLYPALKDLLPKFDEWLKKNTSTLSNSDKKRYRKQKNIINEMIYVFDDESLDDQERFEKNLDLMEKMQSLGSPPEELTVPEGVGKCSVM